jgi:hypothetical protein
MDERRAMSYYGYRGWTKLMQGEYMLERTCRHLLQSYRVDTSQAEVSGNIQARLIIERLCREMLADMRKRNEKRGWS